MIKKERERKNIWPGVILMAFLASLATFFLLLNMEKNALEAYEKVPVWTTNCELAKGLELTENGLNQCLVQVEMDKTKVPEHLIETPEGLVGKQTLYAIPQGTILTSSMFTQEETYRKGLKQPVIAGCKGDDLFQLVSGVLRKGDLVNVYTVNKEVEETYMLWENVMVYQVFDAAGNVIAPEDTATPAARVNLLLEEGCTELLYNELDAGSLRLVKVWE